ncbi:MAG: hypothetical protein ACOC3V_02735 [bacterium]
MPKRTIELSEEMHRDMKIISAIKNITMQEYISEAIAKHNEKHYSILSHTQDTTQTQAE